MTPSPDEIVPTAIPSCLRGVRFPAMKRDILLEARQNGAPRQVMQVLRNIPETEYRGLREVLSNYKRLIIGPLPPAFQN